MQQNKFNKILTKIFKLYITCVDQKKVFKVSSVEEQIFFKQNNENCSTFDYGDEYEYEDEQEEKNRIEYV